MPGPDADRSLPYSVNPMKKLLLCAALLAAPLAHADASHIPYTYTGTAATPAQPREAEIAALFDRWNATLATGDADRMTALYAPDAVLEPTLSNQIRATPADIRSYFVMFLQGKPQAVINYRQIRFLDDGAAVDMGVYTFTLSKNGKAQKVQARYTYVYKKIDGEWKIINHHSSLMPERAS